MCKLLDFRQNIAYIKHRNGIKITKIGARSRDSSREGHFGQESEQLRARWLALERARQADSQQDCFNAI